MTMEEVESSANVHHRHHHHEPSQKAMNHPTSAGGGRRKRFLLVILGCVLLLRLAYMAREALLLRGPPRDNTVSDTVGQCQSLQDHPSKAEFHKTIQRAVVVQGHQGSTGANTNIHVDIHLIPVHPKGQPKGGAIQCNIFHLLWGYVTPFRELVEQGIMIGLQNIQQQQSSSMTVSVNLTIGFYECQKWFESFSKAFPLPNINNIDKKIEISIHNERIVSYGPDVLQAYLTNHQTTTDNCFVIPFQWNSFVGRHDTWKPKQPGSYPVLHMQKWTQAMRDMYLSPPTKPTEDDVCYRKRPLALFVERCGIIKPRTAIDLKTGKNAFQQIQSEVEKLGYDTQTVQICDNVTQQLEVFSNANVVISTHGAQLTNMIFMKPCSTDTPNSPSQPPFQPAIVEVSFRFAWCEPKTPETESNGSRPALLERWRNCPKGNRYYNKADFFRLATGTGLRYTEIIPHSLHNMLGTPDPIEVEQIVVDSQLILDALTHLIQDNTYDYQKQGSYNGWEGVEPYSYEDSFRYYWFRIWKFLRRFLPLE